MNLQTTIPLKRQPHNQIDYGSNIMLLGSCFSENIGGKFQYYKFKTAINPFGILFHPLAIENLISRSINKAYYQEDDLIYHNEQWMCLDAHSSLNQNSSGQLVEGLNNKLDQTRQFIKSATHIIITLGTSWVYRYIETDKIVANCHKLPQKLFLKEILSVDTVTESLDATKALLKTINPKLSILFTVSPVRHLKDGFSENQQSKSHLISAVHNVVEPRNKIYYFPSYELMIDELRDYRFYSDDMIHPNELAINYIWEKFKTIWLSDESIVTLEKVGKIQNRLAHKPFNPSSKQHKLFLDQLHQDITSISKKYPHISFE